MSTLTLLEMAIDRTDVHEELDRRAHEAHARRLGADDVAAVRTEAVLMFRLAAGDSTMTPEQLELAHDQHACRTTNGTSSACDSVVFYRKPCCEGCPVARERAQRRVSAEQKRIADRVKNETFVTDWYMPESHALMQQQAAAEAEHLPVEQRPAA